MCKFLSAIGLKNGDIICDPSIDSHEDLIKFNKLKETRLRNWVRIEFYPDSDKDYADLSKYNLKVDDTEFEWVSAVRDKWERKLCTRLKRIIVTDDRDYLPCGVYILGKCTIGKLIYATIRYAGEATIRYAGRATIRDAGWATIKDAGSATIQNAGYATIQNAGYATIQHAGSATIINKQNAKIT